MATRPNVKGIPSDLRSETAILAAVAREALLECHSRHAVELVELGRGRVPPERMLQIYARLHFLDAEMLADVRGRTLANLGERALRYAVISPVDEPPEEDVQPPPVGVWARVRAVFRGRIHHSLRREVDRHTGQTELALMAVHTEHAVRFARALERRFAPSRAVRLYAEVVGLRESLRETLYLLVLSRLGEEAHQVSVLGFSDATAGVAATL
jgi:hypothetical protein